MTFLLLLCQERIQKNKKRFVINRVICATKVATCTIHLLGGQSSEKREKVTKEKERHKRQGCEVNQVSPLPQSEPKGMWRTKTSAHGHRAHARLFHFSPFEF